MYWKKEKISYNILILPIDKPFSDFTKSEAESYFKWYMGQIESRIEVLKNYSGLALDCSVSSLTVIWGWFLKNAKTERTPKKRIQELKEQLKNQPKEIAKEILNEQKIQFSLETEYIIRDIATYFGEVFVKNNTSISWGYHTDTKLDSFANMPILIGFEDRDFTPPIKTHFDPVFMVQGIASNVFYKDSKKNDLLDLYNKLQRMVYN